MSPKKEIGRNVVASEKQLESSLIERSKVNPNLPYTDYREALREDFIWACGYCTISEFEAQGIRMTIDHYKPRKARPDLTNSYDNLMYCCDDCNGLKGDRFPPQTARDDGHRFFRPDRDYRHEHFDRRIEGAEIYLSGLSNVGKFTVEFLDLNRAALLRLRKIRERFEDCRQHVLHGVLGLKSFHIDQLPPSIKARALLRISEWEDMVENYANEIDSILRGIAYSGMIDRDPEKESRAEERAREQTRLEGLYPGQRWRARKQTNKRKAR